MMQAMKGATMALGSMNRSMNLPSLQRIAMEFERENDIMEQRQEMMDDAIDDAMDVGLEEEGDEVVEQVLEEIGVDLTQSVCIFYGGISSRSPYANGCSSETHLKGYKRRQCRKPRLRRPWAAVVEEAAVPTRATTISRPVWTVYGGSRTCAG